MIMMLMSSLLPFVRKRRKDYVRKKKDGLCRKKPWKNDRNEEKRDMHGKIEIMVKNMGVADDSGYH